MVRQSPKYSQLIENRALEEQFPREIKLLFFQEMQYRLILSTLIAATNWNI